MTEDKEIFLKSLHNGHWWKRYLKIYLGIILRRMLQKWIGLSNSRFFLGLYFLPSDVHMWRYQFHTESLLNVFPLILTYIHSWSCPMGECTCSVEQNENPGNNYLGHLSGISLFAMIYIVKFLFISSKYLWNYRRILSIILELT